MCFSKIYLVVRSCRNAQVLNNFLSFKGSGCRRLLIWVPTAGKRRWYKQRLSAPVSKVAAGDSLSPATSSQWCYFMLLPNNLVLTSVFTDLKKLIKYDLEQRSESQNDRKYNEGPERLHSASTFSSRIRSRASSGPIGPCSRECKELRRPLTARNIYSAPNIGHQGPSHGDKPLRRACSCVRIEKKPSSVAKESKVTTSSNNSKHLAVCYNSFKHP